MSRHTEPSHELRSRERAFEQEVKTNLTRNYIAHFVHGMLGMTGFRMIYAPTFVPAYLYLLSDSAFMVGLGLALLQIGAVLSPIVGASQIEHKTRVLSVAIKTGILMRVQILGLALAGWFLLGNVLIVVTFIFLFFLGFFNGSQRVIFQVLLAKVIPIEKRGRLQAWRNFVGGAIAAALSYWAGAHLIEANVLGNGYATTFMLSLILTCFGLAAIFFLIREPESPSVRRQMSLRKRIRQFPILLQDNNYRHYLVSLLLTTAGRIAVPFCIIYAGEKVEVDGAAIGLFTVAFLGADTVSSLVWGTLGDRHGFRVILLSAIITWICALLLIIFA
ncbi:MAG: hypothetical protein JKY66_05385, partial [Spongiibacteraceae bacterium]|nr:hypothetical protein [Spongiibacteraceae bacterium]